MSNSLASVAQRIAGAALPLESLEFGPWLGSVRSIPADQVSREYGTAGSNFLYLPRMLEGARGPFYGTFKRRGGQTQKFDTFGASNGLLPAKWSSKGRWMDEFVSSSLASDGVPTTMTLVTKETVASGLDDGRFSQVYVRDQVNSLDYTLGSEFSATTYPAPGTAQTYKVTPLWYDSGDGGLTRGTAEFARRFFVSGSRRFRKVGNWIYHPSVLGTPSRWNGERAGGAAAGPFQANSDVATGSPWDTYPSNGGLRYVSIQTSDDATNFIGAAFDQSRNSIMGLNGTVPSVTTFVIAYRARREGVAPHSDAYIQFNINRNDGRQASSPTILVSGVGTSWTDYTTTVTFTGAEAVTANLNRFEALHSPGTGGVLSGYVEITYVQITVPGNATDTNRLIPSGPIAPCHAGSLAKGTAVAGSAAVTLRPDADSIDGAWVNQAASNVNLFASIDESVIDDTDYITSAPLGAFCSIGLSNPGFTPGADDTVVVNYRAKRAGALSPGVISVNLREGTINRATTSASLTTSYANYSFTLTNAEKASISDWTNLLIAFYAGGFDAQFVSQAYVTITPSSDITAGWRGNNRFCWAVAYRFEDGSVWMPTTPRMPNDLLTNGLYLFTVDSANPTVRYNKIVWSNLPLGPKGTKGRVLLRTPKIDSTSSDNLQIDPYDLRVVWEIQDNTTTTYDDYFADDDALTPDIAEAFIRFDHIMPPRARYIFGGDMRICHSYGGQNPCAIEIAPVGRAADYDLNLADDDATAFSSQASFMQIKLDTSGVGTLTLIQGDGATATDTKTFALSSDPTATYGTLQKLVDGINATSFAVDGQQWRAQLCPGASPDATTSTLTPHNRAIASCVIDNAAKTITKTAGGLSKVAVGHFISGAAEETGAMVTVITSDTSLTYSGTLVTGTETLYFYNALGDSQITDPDTTALGFQRVIANSLPGFLYFTKTYLNADPVHKDTVWMTVASPGQAKSAANNFSGRQSNRFAPANASAGISMGGGAVGDRGFVVPFSGAIGVIVNTRDTGSGLDEDYRLQMLNETQGCCAWATVGTGNRFVVYLKPQGLFAADLERELLLSEAIWAHPRSDAALGVGDFDYEIPLCVAATAADTDAAYASTRIMRSAIWVNYRDSGARPDRQVVYDFSGGGEQSGLASLLRPDGTPWGWSNELVRALTAMTAGSRTDGQHLYGWNDANAGSTGDGRLDEFETGDADNGSEIVGSIELPWEKGDEQRQISGYQVLLEHVSPISSTGFLDFTRSYSADLYSLTPGTSALALLREPIFLPQAACVQSEACHLGYRQLTGAAREVRKMTLRLKRIRAYK